MILRRPWKVPPQRSTIGSMESSPGRAPSRWIFGALLLSLLAAQAPAWATARLQNFQLPAKIRIAGQYEIVFKTPAELTDLQSLTPAARASRLKSAVLPETLPISDDDVHALATAIAAEVGGHSLIIFPASNGEGAHFTMSGVSEAAMRALAADPRIDVIAAASSEFQDSCEDSRS
jgi:hypothetical protein